MTTEGEVQANEDLVYKKYLELHNSNQKEERKIGSIHNNIKKLIDTLNPELSSINMIDDDEQIQSISPHHMLSEERGSGIVHFLHKFTWPSDGDPSYLDPIIDRGLHNSFTLSSDNNKSNIFGKRVGTALFITKEVACELYNSFEEQNITVDDNPVSKLRPILRDMFLKFSDLSLDREFPCGNSDCNSTLSYSSLVQEIDCSCGFNYVDALACMRKEDFKPQAELFVDSYCPFQLFDIEDIFVDKARVFQRDFKEIWMDHKLLKKEMTRNEKNDIRLPYNVVFLHKNHNIDATSANMFSNPLTDNNLTTLQTIMEHIFGKPEVPIIPHLVNLSCFNLCGLNINNPSNISSEPRRGFNYARAITATNGALELQVALQFILRLHWSGIRAPLNNNDDEDKIFISQQIHDSKSNTVTRPHMNAHAYELPIVTLLCDMDGRYDHIDHYLSRDIHQYAKHGETAYRNDPKVLKITKLHKESDGNYTHIRQLDDAIKNWLNIHESEEWIIRKKIEGTGSELRSVLETIIMNIENDILEEAPTTIQKSWLKYMSDHFYSFIEDDEYIIDGKLDIIELRRKHDRHSLFIPPVKTLSWYESEMRDNCNADGWLLLEQNKPVQIKILKSSKAMKLLIYSLAPACHGASPKSKKRDVHPIGDSSELEKILSLIQGFKGYFDQINEVINKTKWKEIGDTKFLSQSFSSMRYASYAGGEKSYLGDHSDISEDDSNSSNSPSNSTNRGKITDNWLEYKVNTQYRGLSDPHPPFQSEIEYEVIFENYEDEKNIIDFAPSKYHGKKMEFSEKISYMVQDDFTSIIIESDPGAGKTIALKKVAKKIKSNLDNKSMGFCYRINLHSETTQIVDGDSVEEQKKKLWKRILSSLGSGYINSFENLTYNQFRKLHGDNKRLVIIIDTMDILVQGSTGNNEILGQAITKLIEELDKEKITTLWACRPWEMKELKINSDDINIEHLPPLDIIMLNDTLMETNLSPSWIPEGIDESTYELWTYYISNLIIRQPVILRACSQSKEEVELEAESTFLRSIWNQFIHVHHMEIDFNESWVDNCVPNYKLPVDILFTHITTIGQGLLNEKDINEDDAQKVCITIIKTLSDLIKDKAIAGGSSRFIVNKELFYLKVRKNKSTEKYIVDGITALSKAGLIEEDYNLGSINFTHQSFAEFSLYKILESEKDKNPPNLEKTVLEISEIQSRCPAIKVRYINKLNEEKALRYFYISWSGALFSYSTHFMKATTAQTRTLNSHWSEMTDYVEQNLSTRKRLNASFVQSKEQVEPEEESEPILRRDGGPVHHLDEYQKDITSAWKKVDIPVCVKGFTGTGKTTTSIHFMMDRIRNLTYKLIDAGAGNEYYSSPKQRWPFIGLHSTLSDSLIDDYQSMVDEYFDKFHDGITLLKELSINMNIPDLAYIEGIDCVECGVIDGTPCEGETLHEIRKMHYIKKKMVESIDRFSIEKLLEEYIPDVTNNLNDLGYKKLNLKSLKEASKNIEQSSASRKNVAIEIWKDLELVLQDDRGTLISLDSYIKNEDAFAPQNNETRKVYYDLVRDLQKGKKKNSKSKPWKHITNQRLCGYLINRIEVIMDKEDHIGDKENWIKSLDEKTLANCGYHKETEGQFEDSMATLKNKILNFEQMYYVLVIDEVQDLHPSYLLLLLYLTKGVQDGRAIMITGDEDQALNLSGFDWIDSFTSIRTEATNKLLKEDFRGTRERGMKSSLKLLSNLPRRSSEISGLSINHRNHSAIIEKLKSFWRDFNYHGYPSAEFSNRLEGMYGPGGEEYDISLDADNAEPVFALEFTVEDLVTMITHLEKQSNRMERTGKGVAVVFHSEQLRDEVKKQLVKKKVEMPLFNTFQVKGLEYEAVFIAGGWTTNPNSDILSTKPTIETINYKKEHDPQFIKGFKDEIESIVRTMNVAMSRAKQRLCIGIVRSSKSLNDNGTKDNSEDNYYVLSKNDEKLAISLPPPEGLQAHKSVNLDYEAFSRRLTDFQDEYEISLISLLFEFLEIDRRNKEGLRDDQLHSAANRLLSWMKFIEDYVPDILCESCNKHSNLNLETGDISCSECGEVSIIIESERVKKMNNKWLVNWPTLWWGIEYLRDGSVIENSDKLLGKIIESYVKDISKQDIYFIKKEEDVFQHYIREILMAISSCIDVSGTPLLLSVNFSNVLFNFHNEDSMANMIDNMVDEKIKISSDEENKFPREVITKFLRKLVHSLNIPKIVMNPKFDPNETNRKIFYNSELDHDTGSLYIPLQNNLPQDYGKQIFWNNVIKIANYLKDEKQKLNVQEKSSELFIEDICSQIKKDENINVKILKKVIKLIESSPQDTPPPEWLRNIFSEHVIPNYVNIEDSHSRNDIAEKVRRVVIRGLNTWPEKKDLFNSYMKHNDNKSKIEALFPSITEFGNALNPKDKKSEEINKEIIWENYAYEYKESIYSFKGLRDIGLISFNDIEELKENIEKLFDFGSNKDVTPFLVELFDSIQNDFPLGVNSSLIEPWIDASSKSGPLLVKSSKSRDIFNQTIFNEHTKHEINYFRKHIDQLQLLIKSNSEKESLNPNDLTTPIHWLSLSINDPVWQNQLEQIRNRLILDEDLQKEKIVDVYNRIRREFFPKYVLRDGNHKNKMYNSIFDKSPKSDDNSESDEEIEREPLFIWRILAKMLLTPLKSSHYGTKLRHPDSSYALKTIGKQITHAVAKDSEKHSRLEEMENFIRRTERFLETLQPVVEESIVTGVVLPGTNKMVLSVSILMVKGRSNERGILQSELRTLRSNIVEIEKEEANPQEKRKKKMMEKDKIKDIIFNDLCTSIPSLVEYLEPSNMSIYLEDQDFQKVRVQLNNIRASSPDSSALTRNPPKLLVDSGGRPLIGWNKNEPVPKSAWVNFLEYQFDVEIGIAAVELYLPRYKDEINYLDYISKLGLKTPKTIPQVKALTAAIEWLLMDGYSKFLGNGEDKKAPRIILEQLSLIDAFFCGDGTEKEIVEQYYNWKAKLFIKHGVCIPYKWNLEEGVPVSLTAIEFKSQFEIARNNEENIINNKIINFTSPYSVLRGLWGDEDTDSVTNKEFQHFIPDVWLSPIRELTLPHVEEDGYEIHVVEHIDIIELIKYIFDLIELLDENPRIRKHEVQDEIEIGSPVGVEDEDGDWYGEVVEFDDDEDAVILKREDDGEEYVVDWDSLVQDIDESQQISNKEKIEKASEIFHLISVVIAKELSKIDSAVLQFTDLKNKVLEDPDVISFKIDSNFWDDLIELNVIKFIIQGKGPYSGGILQGYNYNSADISEKKNSPPPAEQIIPKIDLTWTLS